MICRRSCSHGRFLLMSDHPLSSQAADMEPIMLALGDPLLLNHRISLVGLVMNSPKWSIELPSIKCNYSIASTSCTTSTWRDSFFRRWLEPTRLRPRRRFPCSSSLHSSSVSRINWFITVTWFDAAPPPPSTGTTSIRASVEWCWWMEQSS